MEIILKADVEHLGEKDEIVKVRDGYALNFLIPKGFAIAATTSNRKQHEENLRQASRRLQRIKEEAQQVATKLSALTLTIHTLVGKEGKIYGSITPLQLANELKIRGFDIDRKRITIKEEVHSIGKYSANINLHKEVKFDLPFEVVEKLDD